MDKGISFSDLEVQYHTQKAETDHTIIQLLNEYKTKIIEAKGIITQQNEENIKLQQKITSLEKELEEIKKTSDKQNNDKSNK